MASEAHVHSSTIEKSLQSSSLSTGGFSGLQYEFWTIGLFKSLLPDFVVLVFSILTLCWIASTLSRNRQDYTDLRSDRGSVVLQFVLLSPLLIGVLLVIFQIALIVQAKLIVNYAAFCAARSAVVTVPAAIRTASGKSEDLDYIDAKNPDSPKMNIIRRAAALACIGISPRWTPELALQTGSIPGTTGLGSLATTAVVFDASEVSIPDYLSRAQYALSVGRTALSISIEKHKPASKDKSSYEFITANITFQYYLTVPFANRLLGTRFLGLANYFAAAYYLPIQEQYTLLSENDPTFPSGVNPGNQFEVDSYQ